MSGWNTDMIAAERRKRAESSLADASRDELLNRIVDLETSLYKLTYSLNELDVEPGRHCSAYMVSKLFPHSYLDPEQNAEFCKYDLEAKKFVEVSVADGSSMPTADYELAESVTIYDGGKLPDDFEILSVSQSAMAASIYGGAIFMGDVREASRLLWGKPDES